MFDNTLQVQNDIEREIWINELSSFTKGPIKSETNREVADKGIKTGCCICLDTVKEPVVTMCGHLFCKECIKQWIEAKRVNQSCPVCNSKISKDKLIRLYGLSEGANSLNETELGSLPGTLMESLEISTSSLPRNIIQCYLADMLALFDLVFTKALRIFFIISLTIIVASFLISPVFVTFCLFIIGSILVFNFK